MKVCDIEFINKDNCKNAGIDSIFVGDNTLVFFRLSDCSNDELMDILNYKSWILKSWKTGRERKYFVFKWSEYGNDKIIWCYAGFSSILIRYLQNKLGYVVNGKELFKSKEIVELRDMRFRLWDFQEEAVSEWINGGCYGIIKAPTGSGKCSKYNTLILTDKGIIKIEDIVHGIKGKYQNTLSEYGENGLEKEYDEKVLMLEKGYDITAKYDMGLSNVLKVKTKLGFEIIGTLDHKVVVINKNGGLEFKMLKDLTKEDYIAINYNTNIYNNNLKLNYYGDDIKYSINKMNLIEYMNKDISRLMGYIISEGNVIDNRFVITTFDEEMQNDITSICKNLDLDTTYGIYKDKNGGKPSSVLINSVVFVNFVYYLGYIDYAQNKEVPWSILQANKECQIEFLRAMFDGDGTLGFEGIESYNNSKYNDRLEIEYDSSSYELCRQLQIMLLNMGIIGRLRIKKETTLGNKTYEKSYRLVITGGDILKFAEDIGFGLSRKKKVLQKYVEILKGRERWSNIVYPNMHSKLNTLYQKIKEKGKGKDKNLIIEQKVKYPNGAILTERKVVTSHACLKHYGFEKEIWSYISGERTPGKDTLEYILNILSPVSGMNEWKYLNWLKENFIFDKVESIETGKEHVYDLTIDEVHSYIGNGIISHNSVIGCNIIRRMGTRTIICVHTGDLLINVWFNYLIEQFGEGIRSRIGIIGGGLSKKDRKLMRISADNFEENIKKDIVVATSQSLLNKLDILGKEKFGLMIVDEIHHYPSEQFKNIANAIRAPARLGLSATLVRPDGMSPMMNGLIGDVVYRIGIRELVRQGLLVEPVFQSVVLDDKYSEEKIKNTKLKLLDYARYVKKVSAGSTAKFNYIIDLCVSLTKNSKKFMLYTDFVSNLKIDERKSSDDNGDWNYVYNRGNYVTLLLDRGVRVIEISSDMSGVVREGVFNMLKNGELDGIVFGSLGNEGINIPIVDSVVMCNCTASTIRYPQRVGRAMRVYGNKKNCYIYEVLLNVEKEIQWSKENFFEYGTEGYMKERIWLDVNGKVIRKEKTM